MMLGKGGWQNEMRKRWVLGKEKMAEQEEEEEDAGKREEWRTRQGRRGC